MSFSFLSLKRATKLGWSNFWRNRSLTIGATLLMMLTLLMIGLSLLISYTVRDTSEIVRSKIGLTIFFRDDSLSDEKINQLSSRISSVGGVDSVEFVSKADALAVFNRLKINEDIKKPLNEQFNPLPRSLEIKLSDVSNIEEVVNGIEQQDREKIICSDCLSYKKNKDVVERLVTGTRLAQQIGWVLSLLFGLIAIFNVSNIIRITINARADELEIMRYVGASNWFVRGPFMVEGVICGLLGTIGASAILLIGAKILTPYWESSQQNSASAIFSFMGVSLDRYLLNNLGMIILIQLAVGVMAGLLVSYLSVRRYLRA